MRASTRAPNNSRNERAGGASSTGGEFRLRIENLDQTRCRPEFVHGIYEDLEWLGLNHDGPVIVQSQRSAAYDEALGRLKAKGLAYPCFCTRADIAAALEAPHGAPATHYPGTCRGLPDDPERRAARPHSWRLDTAKALKLIGLPSWTEDGGRLFTSCPGDFGDVILARKDAPAAYHLACAVDDAASGVTLVVRAADLRSSTPMQRLLQDLLGLSRSRTISTTRLSLTPMGAASPSAIAPRLSLPCGPRALTAERSPPSSGRASFHLVSLSPTPKGQPCAGRF